MKVVHFEEHTIKTEVIDDILCNRCGKSCRIDTDAENLSNCTDARACFGGLTGAEVFGKYESGHGLFDMTRYKFSICELCLVEMFDSFKIPPDIFCLIDSMPVTIEEHRKDRAARELRRKQEGW